MIPLPYKLLGLALIAIGLFAVGWRTGSHHVQSAWDEAKAAQSAHVETVQAAQAAVTVQTVTKYVDRIKTVTAPAQEVLRAIPTYLPTDRECPAAVGMLIRSAEDGVPVPSPAAVADAAPTSAADIATWGVETIAACKANAEQLISLQGWVTAVGAAK